MRNANRTLLILALGACAAPAPEPETTAVAPGLEWVTIVAAGME